MEFEMNSAPLVSVLMGVYNCESTLEEAIDSIVGQTYKNWELIICDDGSSDGTPDVARSYAAREQRIKLIRNATNLGLAPSLNRCLRAASGSLVARMDGDDISASDRFQTQVSVLLSSPDLAIVSTAMDLFDEDGVWGRTRPTKNPSVPDLLLGPPFAHAPVLMRREALDEVGGYSELSRHWRVEDYHLWVKLLIAGHRGTNLSTPLYAMRNDREAAARRTFRARSNEARLILEVARLQRSPIGCIRSLRPLLIALLPRRLYLRIHRWKQRERNASPA